jgi:hypothetical protein
VAASDGNEWAVMRKANIVIGTEAVLGCRVDTAGNVDAPRSFFQTVGGVGYYFSSNFQLTRAEERNASC